ncbi:gamma-glutamyl AIG2-like cyclotransferase [Diaminobutyricimonas aerilata]|uniref:Gamma-glutamyl AIG2-like cyclotransferase n=1 Tax=Diaminobutyricimonas aerilata TaxID=1162967 RepID=A0A2M9CFR6_9MICO|nr:gamma-glutamylcyclotransferase family protein [Diaminobutyricimonas aerilata]PJJ70781.1 gamma-glutamyl AIG2-like cyclotransferase [Diaminobutyricimonas aerilata]
MSALVFSFGTLRLERVQLALFGRVVPTQPDTLAGYRLGEVRITDPDVIAASGSDVHPGLEHTGRPSDRVDGAVLELDQSQLAAADHYERVAYRRIGVRLESGRDAFVYVPKDIAL